MALKYTSLPGWKPKGGNVSPIKKDGDAPESESIGQVLRKARERSRLTPRQVELGTRIPSSHLTRVEDGTIAQPSIRLLIKLARHYRADFDELAVLAGYELPKLKDVDEARRQAAQAFIEAIYGGDYYDAG